LSSHFALHHDDKSPPGERYLVLVIPCHFPKERANDPAPGSFNSRRKGETRMGTRLNQQGSFPTLGIILRNGAVEKTSMCRYVDFPASLSAGEAVQKPPLRAKFCDGFALALDASRSARGRSMQASSLHAARTMAMMRRSHSVATRKRLSKRPFDALETIGV
jgi:hypothetical protein